MDALFRSLQRPVHRQAGSWTAHHFSLRGLANDAVPISNMVLLVSRKLKEALSKPTGMTLVSRESLDGPDSMRELYHRFYSLRQNGYTAISRLNDTQRKQLHVLQLFMDQTFGADYAGADALSTRNRFSQMLELPHNTSQHQQLLARQQVQQVMQTRQAQGAQGMLGTATALPTARAFRMTADSRADSIRRYSF
ncbi:hypothetical protein BJX96DRAFT_172580 [Aspergillus floccosus]